MERDLLAPLHFTLCSPSAESVIEDEQLVHGVYVTGRIRLRSHAAKVRRVALAIFIEGRIAIVRGQVLNACGGAQEIVNGKRCRGRVSGSMQHRIGLRDLEISGRKVGLWSVTPCSRARC